MGKRTSRKTSEVGSGVLTILFFRVSLDPSMIQSVD